jgi:hypothetical protein
MQKIKMAPWKKYCDRNVVLSVPHLSFFAKLGSSGRKMPIPSIVEGMYATYTYNKELGILKVTFNKEQIDDSYLRGGNGSGIAIPKALIKEMGWAVNKDKTIGLYRLVLDNATVYIFQKQEHIKFFEDIETIFMDEKEGLE